jgi:hypothetical protein
MSPIGTFEPFDPTERSPRFFARPIAFDCECPQCGRLFLVGPARRDNDDYNRVTGELHCRLNVRKGVPGCGRTFLMGMVAWNLTTSQKRARPADHRPNHRQLAELRQATQGIWAKGFKSRGDPINTIQDLP